MVKAIANMAVVPRLFSFPIVIAIMLLGWMPGEGNAQDMSDLIKKIKPSIVAIATFQATRHPPVKIMATGFVVGDGNHVITNDHTIPKILNSAAFERLVVLTGHGKNPTIQSAKAVARDPGHDTAVLRIEGPALPVLDLGGARIIDEGSMIGFTGYPIGSVLGLYPVSHQGMISAITPIIIPAPRSKTLDPKMILRLRSNFMVYQLDATAYPGNSGSPVYDLKEGRVRAIISAVFVKNLKEKVISDPSGIAYAIPIKYARDLLDKLGVRK